MPCPVRIEPNVEKHAVDPRVQLLRFLACRCKNRPRPSTRHPRTARSSAPPRTLTLRPRRSPIPKSPPSWLRFGNCRPPSWNGERSHSAWRGSSRGSRAPPPSQPPAEWTPRTPTTRRTLGSRVETRIRRSRVSPSRALRVSLRKHDPRPIECERRIPGHKGER